MTRRDFITGGIAAMGAACLASPVRSNMGGFLQQYIPFVPDGPFTASDYSQDGLIAQFDAIENIGYGERDENSLRWVELVGGNAFSLPEGVIWGANYLIMPDVTYRSMRLGFNFNSLWEAGAVTILFAHKTIDLADATGITFYMFTGNGGGIQVSPAWGNMSVWNNVCAFNGASNTAWPGTRRMTDAESRALVECASWVNPEDETHAYGWTRLNGEIVREWTGGYNSWLYNQAKGKTGNYMFFRGKNELWQSILIYNKILTDEERAWNLRVTKARFGI